MKQENDFVMDTARPRKNSFVKGMGWAFVLGLILSGSAGLVGLAVLIDGVINRLWLSAGASAFLRGCVGCLAALVCFVILIVMTVDERPFTRILTGGIYTISALYAVGAFLLPRMADYAYNNSGFGILVIKGVPLFDGSMLLPASLLFILGAVLKRGFEMQKELDDIL